MIPLISTILSLLVDFYKADQATRAKFLSLIEAARKSTLIPAQARDEFAKQDSALDKMGSEP